MILSRQNEAIDNVINKKAHSSVEDLRVSVPASGNIMYCPQESDLRNSLALQWQWVNLLGCLKM